ncbi:MAG TPA: sigma-54-dependent Fis family transcriptional regulator [Burkholderiaceae bacterium]|nr:sigma-54-dependent Fis family transcriptional regulator [Burkholderiaceae bacterium]
MAHNRKATFRKAKFTATDEETELMRMGADPPQARRALRQFLERGSLGSGSVDGQIERSWQRCRQIGIAHADRLAFDPVNPQDLVAARERNRVLTVQALPIMEGLHRQIIDTESMILLTDASGLILHSLGDDAFLRRAEKVALQPGVVWSEASRGTNAIGTALADRAPRLVHGAEHFVEANQVLTCSAAPIMDPRGNMIGVLDVSGDWRGHHRHTMALVQMSAGLIENNLFHGAFPSSVTIRFHARAELIGTLFEGIAVFDADGCFVTANRSALFQLGASLAELSGRTFTSLFDLPMPALLGQAQARPEHLIALPLPSGVKVPARVELGVDLRSAHRTVSAHRPQPERAAAADSARKGYVCRAPGTLAALESGDPQIGTVISQVRKVIGRDIPILILGETGTGKELFARAIHTASPRAEGPFVAVNCASIPEGLIESELFGYEEGAFTGARKRGYAGRILQADGGTLFLDEIGDMPLNLQARLLRVLQERVVVPLGGVRAQPIDIAIICATHRRLKEAIAEGRFREDLYYRLNGLQVKLPALRERSDLAVLVKQIIAQLGADSSRVQASDEVLTLFGRHRWPGNLRQLSSLLRTALAMLDDENVIEVRHLPQDFLEDVGVSGAVTPAPAQQPARSPLPALVQEAAPIAPARGTLEEQESEAIRNSLKQHGGNVSAAARALGVSRNTIYRRLGGSGAANPTSS